MKNAKNIILLIIATAMVIVATYFVYSVYKEIDVPSERNSLSEMSNQNRIDSQVELRGEMEKDKRSENNEFTIYNENKNEINLSDYEGKPIYMLFWKMNKEESVEMLEMLNEYYERYKNSIAFLAISVTDGMLETVSSVEDFVKQKDILIPIHYDLNSDAILSYNVNELPTSISIDKDGNIFKTNVGTTGRDALEATLDILANNI